MKASTVVASLAIAVSTFSSIASASVTMDWVTVGNGGNAADTTGYGAVAYEYKIGKYEVTNAQYGAFLNAAAKTDSYGLYNSSMSTYGITQSGSSGSYTYSVTGALANRPVVYVSWFDAARFANWLTNGQGSGDTETGAYTLNGAISGMFNATIGEFFLKNAGAQVYIPTEDEWYKAAYYNGATSTYSQFPNGQNTITMADGNFYDSSGSTDVGSYNDVPSSYGTFDQGGNVWEWNDAIKNLRMDDDYRRGVRGGGWYGASNDFYMNTSYPSEWYAQPPSIEHESQGFRLASVIPEPTSMALTMFAGGLMLIRRKR
jgi:sulfatase modifying factor 1